MLALALSSYLSLYPVLLTLPLILLSHDQRPPANPKTIIQTTTTALSTFVSALTGLICLSYFLTGRSWEFISSTYGVQLLLPDLTPNVGLWWYFFIEMFDSFREFFLGVFWLHLAGYVGGLSVKLRYVSIVNAHVSALMCPLSVGINPSS
jgi:phosphatidylinositol glycan class U